MMSDQELEEDMKWYGRQIEKGSNDRTIRTHCVECEIPLFGNDGEELPHGSYCDLDAREYELD